MYKATKQCFGNYQNCNNVHFIEGDTDCEFCKLATLYNLQKDKLHRRNALIKRLREKN